MNVPIFAFMALSRLKNIFHSVLNLPTYSVSLFVLSDIESLVLSSTSAMSIIVFEAAAEAFTSKPQSPKRCSCPRYMPNRMSRIEER